MTAPTSWKAEEMSEHSVELQATLTGIKRQWTQRAWLRAWTRGAAAAATVVLVGFVASLLIARDGLPLLITAAVVLIVAVFAIARALWPCRHAPKEPQIARFIEERTGGLDDVVVTAVDYAARPEASARMREALAADAARALAAIDLDLLIPKKSRRLAAVTAGVATIALAVSIGLFAPKVSRGANVAGAYLFPQRLTLEVTPGTGKLRAGQPLAITARVAGLAGEVIPTLTLKIGDETRTVRMVTTEVAGTFAVAIERVDESFAYRVDAAAARSDDYRITVIKPPRVERIDLRYEFPRGLGLAPRTDQDSGDIYGPAGTRVQLTVTADKPIKNAFLVLDDGRQVALAGAAAVLEGALTISDDGSYRIALADQDGLSSAGDTEYFIRTLADRPPDVRIIRPASDKQVTPLEEVTIEARADDDYGIASLDLVFQSVTGTQKTVALRGRQGGLTAAGLHTLFMEELGVQPGDFVTYYARARDVGRGRRSTEARSDIFFLEVKPFEEEFVAAQSQSMGQGGSQSANDLQALAEAQKEIIVATWKLDARARRAQDAGSRQDITAVSKSQADLRVRAERASAQASRATDPRRRRGAPPPGENPLGKAVEAMGRAVHQLDAARTSVALTHEMEALNQLLKAEADVRRRQVSRQQQAGGGGGVNRSEADLSNLFDQELRKRQQTNYESPNSTETREDEKQEDPLERIRELARRQDALNKQQHDLERNRERVAAEELKRQLERLTRDQNELRQQAERLAQQMQQASKAPSSQSSSGQSQSGQSQGRPSQTGQAKGGQSLRDISQDMRDAATGMSRQDPQQASSSGGRAAERLRDLEKQMQGARPDDRRRALGDLQLETRQLADAQRRLGNEAGRTSQGQPGDDARRRLAGEQDRLADRADRLKDQVQRLSRSGEGKPEERTATSETVREIDKQKLAERMRASAESLRQPGGRDREGESVARGLDKIADQLGAAAGTKDADSRRLSDQLSKTQELRDSVAQLQRSIEQLQREAQPGQGAQQASQGRESAGGQQGGSTGADGGRVQQLQREVNERMREAERLTADLRRDNPGMQGEQSQEWWRSFSAPGTEAFKQDFARWESLKKNLLVAIEGVESKVSDELRDRENKERFNAGGHQAVGEAYRDMVEKYYRSLAAPRKR
ncbi:MAG TPA: hypothetical protein VNJ02_16720 [Vicinamibacterales bacterium]|nr:hypothetical protein [Vicinamibacterales bacterium]